jgi:hypothetical protein
MITCSFAGSAFDKNFAVAGIVTFTFRLKMLSWGTVPMGSLVDTVYHLGSVSPLTPWGSVFSVKGTSQNHLRHFKRGHSMKLTNLALAGALAASLTGCATAHSPVTGFWYTNVKGGIQATEAYGGTARGEACASSILGVVATGDASIDTAKKAGGIAQVVAIDHTSNSILGVYAKYCTVVYGKRGASAAPAKTAPTETPAQ